ncbi:MAG: hypothetical protein IKX50_05185 [Spirochaetia bacterium]|nr:hypothetical protein [Spirochaetia bacterium]
MTAKEGCITGGCLPIILIMIGMFIYYGNTGEEKKQPQMNKEEIIEAPQEPITQNKIESNEEPVKDEKIEISPEWMNTFKESISSVIKKTGITEKKDLNLNINIAETKALIKSFSFKIDGIEYIGETNSKGAVEYLKKKDLSGDQTIYPITKVVQQEDKQKGKETSQNNNAVKLAGKEQIRRLNDFLKSGFAIVDNSKVFYKKSKDFNNAFFVGTMIVSRYTGDLYPCVWITNQEDFSGVMLSANKYATETSYPMHADKTQMHVNSRSDGYIDVLNKVNEHFGALLP